MFRRIVPHLSKIDGQAHLDTMAYWSAGSWRIFGTAEKEGALDLIEQFKIAREANFLLSGKTDSPQQKKEEVLRIQQEWKTLGPTVLVHEQRLWKRYRKALDLFFAK